MSHRVQRLQNQLSNHSRKQPVKVCVTGAAGNIAYALLFQIGAGRMLGEDQPIELRLLDIPVMADKITGVEMELRDCAFPLITDIISTTDYQTAFDQVDICLLVGARPRGPGMERKDLLRANAEIFQGQGQALNKYASRSVKVCVVGNPANTNALIAMHNAPDLPKHSFTALTRLDQNRALSQISVRLGVPVDAVKNVIIWGNHSKTQYPDIRQAVLRDGERVLPLRAVVGNDVWLENEFLTTVQDRGAAIIKARQLSSAASAANAVVDHVRDWVLGTAAGEFVSMAVPSDGSYGVPEGIIYSFPVVCRNGGYSIVQGLNLDQFSQDKMKATAQELLEERHDALGF